MGLKKLISRWDRRTLPLEHAIVVQAVCQAVVCGTMCLQAACKLLAYGTRLSWRHSAIYSTWTNTALDLLGVGSTSTSCLWTKNFESHSRSLNNIVTLKSRLRVTWGRWNYHHSIDRISGFLFVFHRNYGNIVFEIKRSR